MTMRCPTCYSPSPERHPAVQHGGEVQTCHDAFHNRHGNIHNRERYAVETRSQLCGGHLTDEQVAYQTAMLMRNDPSHEAVLITAKDRIRWLSTHLQIANARISELESGRPKLSEATVTGIAARAKARIAGAPATLAQIERAAIVDAMAAEDGNMTATAKRLGIGRATLYRKVKEYGL